MPPLTGSSGRRLPRLIGVIHLPALPGAPAATGQDPTITLQKAGLLAVREAKMLAQAGFDGIILENFGDAPFYRTEVPPEVISSMSIIAAAVRETSRAMIGINVLRNDAHAALAIATITGCEFIRVNVLSGVAATDQGIIEGDAAFLARERARLGSDVAILADVHVKHARMLSSDRVEIAVEEAGGRGSADGIIVTGSTTGRTVEIEKLRQASEAARHIRAPLFIGSGATPENLTTLLELADGVIVGSALRVGGVAGRALDPKRVRAFAGAFRKCVRGSRAVPSQPRRKPKARRKTRKPTEVITSTET